jgi:hypothetical protein
MADPGQLGSKDPVITLQDLLDGKVVPFTTTGSVEVSHTRKKKDVGDVEISNARTDNQSKILLIGAMIATVLIALLVGSYKYLNIGIHCIPAASGAQATTATSQAGHINCPYDVEQQKDAGSLLQSIVSGVVGIVAGMGIGSRRN